MIIKIFFLLIILYIIIEQYLDKPIIKKEKTVQLEEPVVSHKVQALTSQRQQQLQALQVPQQMQIQEFSKPNPWTKVILDASNEYPYNFHIKLKIPSLNDYEDWKQIIPNIDFNARTGELVIPSKDEASALAIANLISSNFSGHLSLKEILDKKLIQISINKAKNYELVQNKFREQIMENLYGSTQIKPLEVKEFKETCSLKKVPKNQNISSDAFVDTFQHFTYEQNNEGVNPYDSNGYSAF
jgi:hypothetical protein